jgi:hypothetical protein
MLQAALGMAHLIAGKKFELKMQKQLVSLIVG